MFVVRRAPLLQLVEYILRVYLLSSRAFLSQHQQSSAAAAAAQGVEDERDKLRAALLLTQESAAVQILLEATLEDELLEDQVGYSVASDARICRTKKCMELDTWSFE